MRLIFFHAPIFFIAASAILSWRSLRHPYPLSQKLFSIAWTIWFLVDAACHVMAHFNMDNLWLYNILYMIYFPALAYAYQHQLTQPRILLIIKFFYPLFFVFVIINTAFIEGIKKLQTLTVVTGGTFAIFLSAAFFWELYKSEDNGKITREPFFWFSTGIMICYGGTIPFIGMLNYLVKNYLYFTRFYYVYFYDPFFILLSVLTAIGFLCRKNFQT